MIAFILRILIVLVGASAIGLIAGVAGRGIPLIPDAQELLEQERWRESVKIELDEFRKDLASAGCVVLDARSPEDFSRSRLKAALILNMPPDAVTIDVADRLRNLGLPIVIYCSSATCELAEDCHKAISQYATIPDLRIYFPGWMGIEKHPELIDSGPVPARDWFDGMATAAPDSADPSAGVGDGDSVGDPLTDSDQERAAEDESGEGEE